jgi:hypothetical protein
MAVQARNLETLSHFTLHPTASETSSFTGATTNIADIQQLEGDIQIILDCNAGTGGTTTLALKVQTSPTTTSGDFADLASGGSFTSLTTVASKQVLTIPRSSLNRYIRLATTQGAGSTYVYSVNGYGVPKYQ